MGTDVFLCPRREPAVGVGYEYMFVCSFVCVCAPKLKWNPSLGGVEDSSPLVSLHADHRSSKKPGFDYFHS